MARRRTDTSFPTRGKNPRRGGAVMGFPSATNPGPSRVHSEPLPMDQPHEPSTDFQRNPQDESEPSASDNNILVPLPSILQSVAAGAVHSELESQTSLDTAHNLEAPNPYILCASFLVAFLHTRHHVSFRACTVILVTLGMIFSAIPGNILNGAKVPRTLTTVFARFDLKDRFKVYPICHMCHKYFDPDIASDTMCPDCENRIFRPQTRSLFRRLFETVLEPIVPADLDEESDSFVGGEPHVVAPMRPLSDGLQELFSRPGMVSAAEAWRAREHVPDELKSMQDAEVWKTIKGPDKKSFFFEGDCDTELRVGVSLSLDWFGRKTSSYGPSHSSGALSFCVQNFENALRCKADNQILSAMPPGPNEPTAAQLQNHLKMIVDDLIMLYDEGIVITSPEHPNGKRLRVALVAIIADHPAMCKLCGFADHAHNVAPCTKCHVPRDEIFTEKSLRNGYPARTGEEHRKLCFEYRALETDAERTAFFSKYGAQWTEFARLLYFDLVRFTVVEPMHNLLLGLGKTQWYTRWIKEDVLRPNTKRANAERELHLIHEFLETFEAPLWAGRLPLRVGEPAGGSLTADEYKFAITGPWAIIIPIVWDKFIKDSEKTHKKEMDKYETEKANYETKKQKWEEKRRSRNTRSRATEVEAEAEPQEPVKPRPRMTRDEPENFLKFSTALKIMIGNSIRCDKIERAKSLLEEYLLGFARLYGYDEMKPNHHWAVHMPDQIIDYGPLYTFWAFMAERLNKILKNLNSNNWTAGRLEVSMMREFHRTVGLDSVMERHLTNADCQPLERMVIEYYTSDGENREAQGTVQDAARDEQTLTRVKAGSIAEKAEKLSDTLRFGLEHYYNRVRPQVHQPLATNPSPNTLPLASYAETYNFALLDGRRITPTSRSVRNSAGSSIVQAKINDRRYAGEIRSVFIHRQPGVEKSNDTLLAAIQWMKRSTYTPLEDPAFVWDKFRELGVETWELDTYVDPLLNDPPMIMRLEDIHCQLCRGRVTHIEPKLWITATMDRFPTSLNAYGFGDATEDSDI